MRAKQTLMGLLAGLVVCGCEPSPTGPAPESIPLTVEEWRKLPVDEKFEVVSFERLKLGTPELQDDRKWDRFYKSEVVPAMKKKP